MFIALIVDLTQSINCRIIIVVYAKLYLCFRQMAQQHILSAVESEITSGKDKGDPTERDLRVTLDDRDLWVRFQCFTNEMIVTKSGRYVTDNFKLPFSAINSIVYWYFKKFGDSSIISFKCHFLLYMLHFKLELALLTLFIKIEAERYFI